MLDKVPLLQRVKIVRKREIEKEIGPEFRFQPRTNQERLLDYIQKSGLAQLQDSELSGNKSKRKRKGKKQESRSVSICQNKKVSEDLSSKHDLTLPQIHRKNTSIKTHFQAATSLLLYDNKNDLEEEDSSFMNNTKDYTSLARDVLKRCRIIRNKHFRINDMLRKGEGKLMHTCGTPLKDVEENQYSTMMDAKQIKLFSPN